MSSPTPSLDDATVAALVAAARGVRTRAHAPHSGFPVGAALLTRGGHVVAGCNVESASYGLTLCAERAAAARAIAEGTPDLVAVVVIADSPRPVPPCGACRQFLFDLAPDLQVVYGNLDGDLVRTTLRALLPEAFEVRHLERARPNPMS
jgi:cytidine deaminase